jgi:hypothetical protein
MVRERALKCDVVFLPARACSTEKPQPARARAEGALGGSYGKWLVGGTADAGVGIIGRDWRRSESGCSAYDDCWARASASHAAALPAEHRSCRAEVWVREQPIMIGMLKQTSNKMRFTIAPGYVAR